MANYREIFELSLMLRKPASATSICLLQKKLRDMAKISAYVDKFASDGLYLYIPLKHNFSIILRKHIGIWRSGCNGLAVTRCLKNNSHSLAPAPALAPIETRYFSTIPAPALVYVNLIKSAPINNIVYRRRHEAHANNSIGQGVRPMPPHTLGILLVI